MKMSNKKCITKIMHSDAANICSKKTAGVFSINNNANTKHMDREINWNFTKNFKHHISL